MRMPFAKTINKIRPWISVKKNLRYRVISHRINEVTIVKSKPDFFKHFEMLLIGQGLPKNFALHLD